MNKYASLIWSGILALLAIGVIVWIIRESSEQVDDSLRAAPIAPDEGAETLNGLSPLNAQVEVAPAFLTYNVPQPGNVAPINDSNQDSLTMGQLFSLGAYGAQESVDNLLAVGLPASDFTDISQYN